jgi:hypothetical protein
VRRAAVEDRAWAGFGHRLLVDLELHEPVQQHVHIGVADGHFPEQGAIRQGVLAVLSRHQDRVGQGLFNRPRIPATGTGSPPPQGLS